MKPTDYLVKMKEGQVRTKTGDEARELKGIRAAQVISYVKNNDELRRGYLTWTSSSFS